MLLKNGIIINPETNTEHKADIRIENEIIVEIGDLEEKYDEEVIDLTDKYISPGLIDMHCHIFLLNRQFQR